MRHGSRLVCEIPAGTVVLGMGVEHGEVVITLFGDNGVERVNLTELQRWAHRN